MTDDVKASGVDFHCHLDLFPDYEAAIARTEAARIYTLTVTTTPKAWMRNYELTRGTRYIRAALGLHPQVVAERAGELPLWERHLPETRYIGEVGLDAGPRFYKSLETQKYVFRTILVRCAEAGKKILSVHSMRCVPAVLDMIELYLPRDRGTVVLHWFTGTKSEVRRAVNLGCYFSVNAQMVKSDRGRALVADLPMDRILTETDGPFIDINGHPAEPTDIHVTADLVARLRNVHVQELAKTVIGNLHTLVD
ncbi:Qat anti-phage system TatD family nuclease QatD [Geotalea toluenoxydans]|uniref:Qat anti-phage system TatD family nuclease QatD n=1 Tax=Geotalea toluenoxydans TaxID=421624 RepID=UPI0006CF593D|nr:Qat anti-phage system TatD family nuclease QatD [Geotalea toluenoxydans]